MSKKATAKKRATQRAATRTERWRSEVYILDSQGAFDRAEQDGVFVLTINDSNGVVTGNHSHPNAHNVNGNILPTNPPGIVLRSNDGARSHSGALIEIGGQKYYIGARLPGVRSLRQQEEGVWVGTKVG